jgi:hypothetical protein
VSNEDNSEQFFNGPLYTLKALSIATALVTLGATASIWGVMKALNARDVGPYNLMTFLPGTRTTFSYRPTSLRNVSVMWC